MAAAALLVAGAARAQTAPAAAAQASAPEARVCGQAVPPPARLPAADSGPVVLAIVPCFEKQGGTSVIEANTYLYYIQLRPSRPSADAWVPYDETVEKTIRDDFRRLWATNFLDDLSIEVQDYPMTNGVVGKLVVYHMEERQRVKIVDYVGSKALDQTKIDERLKEKGITIRLDSFIDPGLINRVSATIREMLSEKGYQFGEVTPSIKPMAGGPKLVHLSFQIAEGPKVKIKEIDFVGNKEVSDGALKGKMKETKEQWFLSFITGRGTYQETKFEEDAEKVIAFYREKGYIGARVGQPELAALGDSPDGKTRYVRLKIPVTEGERYRVGDFNFDGNTVIRTEALRPMFKLKEGDFYNEDRLRKGLEKAREIYGAVGYWEFTAYPELAPRDEPKPPEEQGPFAADDQKKPAGPVRGPDGRPIVDVTMKVQQGEQYFVNRITFKGNTTTRDNVIRRELQLVENGVFNTEALKYSIKRLNQLGYFKELEQDKVTIEKTPGEKDQVDLTLNVEEQNRNQLSFGAGVSQFEGFFGQLSFQTSNFLGRGETFSVGVQAGSRAQNYQLAFTEPFLFDRPITAGINLFKNEVRYPNQYTQASTGGSVLTGFPVGAFTRMFLSYSYEFVKVKDLNELYLDPEVLARNPFLADSLLIGEGGRRIISKITPSIVHNTVDNPIFPNAGRRLSATLEYAGIGGDTNFIKPRLEAIQYWRHTARTSLGVRGLVEYVRPYGSTLELPIFEKLFLGGEYSIRGFDLRSIGPRDPATGLVTGGNKSVLLNLEYLITIAGPLRLVLFYDAGQVRDQGESFAWKEPITQRVQAVPLVPAAGFDQFLVNPIDTAYEVVTTGETSAFKTSTGAEVRFFMPVLNVPFRLIFAYNPQRYGVYDNSLQPQKSFTFRFAVGSTF